MGFEPTTPTLARLCSTPELHPRSVIAAMAAGESLLCQIPIEFATDLNGAYTALKPPGRIRGPCGPDWSRWTSGRLHAGPPIFAVIVP